MPASASELGADAVEHPRDAVRATDRQAPARQPAKEHRPRAQGERDQHVRAGADAAVEVHLRLAADRARRRAPAARQRGNRARHLPAAVVGDDQRRAPASIAWRASSGCMMPLGTMGTALMLASHSQPRPVDRRVQVRVAPRRGRGTRRPGSRKPDAARACAPPAAACSRAARSPGRPPPTASSTTAARASRSGQL